MSSSRGSSTNAVAAASTTRRRFLQIAAGAVLAASSAVAGLRTRGYDVAAARAARLQALSPWQLVVVEHLARRIAAPDRPDDRSIPTPDDTDVAGFVDAYVARMPAALRRDLSRCFAYVEHVAPLRSGLAARFTRLGPDAQDRVLAALEASDQDLLRGAFSGLKSLVFMGYYRDPRTWSILQYDGPLVDRPEGGWSGQGT
jgi:hypothetical protein